MIHYIALPIVGLLVGIFIVSLGGGGGAIYVGILMTLFHISPEVAASTSLATMIPTLAAGTYSHWKAGNVNLKLGKYMSAGGIAGVLIGALLSGMIPAFWYSKIAGVIFVLLSIQMLVSIIGKRKKEQHSAVSQRPFTFWKICAALAYGVLGGVMCGLLGLSGGGPIVAGLFVLGSSMTESAGTSVFVLTALSIVGLLMHLSLGNIDWGLVGLLLLGTVMGALIGPVFMKHVNKNLLEHILQPVMFVLIFVMGAVLIL
ncbi:MULTISPECIES: sulfite exporter TauE/SafE family protein [unclassified Sporolactobacillus]|uniref:sulfite exporter TauE/SafE family protein n=1 Tax=unclassified Sporolactobacillus TaxID=2628533 RepID=UPI002367438E|nr:sulfite exporter TauE/SafE family protein [Sporolactobacillus sp. CQH2019]MDD9150319.1 sulfite exporter TauE/SafE family protein [Sporolactobacillus sp. CQH2019]